MPEVNIQIDTPESYEAHSLDVLTQITNRFVDADELARLEPVDMSTDQKEALTKEVKLLGVDYTNQPEEFLRLHAELLDALEVSLTGELPDVKERMIAGVVDFLGLSGAEAEETSQRLRDRGEATKQVIIIDNIMSRDAGPNASFLNMQRQVVMSGRKLINLVADHDIDSKKFRKITVDNFLSHEGLHCLMVAGTQDTFISPHLNIRNGIRIGEITNPYDEDKARRWPYGRWVSEAVLETIRRHTTGFDEGAYTPGVIIFEIAEKLDPGVTKFAVEVAYLDKSPGELFGRLELLFGPSAIDDLDESIFLADRDGVSVFRSEVLGLVDPSKLPPARRQLEDSFARHASALATFPV